MPLVHVLNALLWAGQNGLPPAPDTLHLGCSYHLHSSAAFGHTVFAFSLFITCDYYSESNYNARLMSICSGQQTTG